MHQKLFQIRALVLAVTVGDFKRRIEKLVIPIDAHRGGVEVDVPRIDIKGVQGILGQL